MPYALPYALRTPEQKARKNAQVKRWQEAQKENKTEAYYRELERQRKKNKLYREMKALRFVNM